MTGRFIVLEGIDGCGKTTQIQHLVEWLPNSGLMPRGAAVVCTREPGGTPLGRSIRELLLHTADQEATTRRDYLHESKFRAESRIAHGNPLCMLRTDEM